MKNCQDVIRLIPDLLAGNLDQVKSDQLQQHLKSCPSCQAEAECLNRIWEKLKAVPEEIPDEGLTIRFNNMLEAFKLGMKPKKVPLTLKTFFRRLAIPWQTKVPSLQFASVVLLLLVGLVSGYLLHPLISKENNVGQLRSEIAALQQMIAASLLKQESASDRLQGVIWSAKVANQSSDILSKLMLTLNSDPNVNVRLAVVDALYLYRKNPLIRDSLINSLALQESPLVQLALVDLLSDIKEEKALNALKELINKNHLNPEVKKRAESWIDQLM